MVTDEDKLDAPYMPSALLADIRKRSGGHWSWSNKKALDKIYERDRFIRAESAERERKESANRALSFMRERLAPGVFTEIMLDEMNAAIIMEAGQ